MKPYIEIAGRKIGPGEPTYVIAELSANHNQDFEQAVRIVHAAHEAGADAIKLQTYTPDTLTIDCRNEHFMVGKGTIWEGKNLYELYAEAYTPWDWQPKLMSLAQELGMHCFSTPFDDSSVDFLESLNVPAYKIASFELVDIPLLKRVASMGKPVIASTGMATLEEIEEAVSTLQASGCEELALLRCNSAYPAPPEDMNLRSIPELARRFGIPIGLSDHTLNLAVPVTAVALGACILEKHFTLSRSVPGPDSAFSLEPAEFKAMVDEIRIAEKALGGVRFEPSEKEKASQVFRRSLFVVQDVEAGEEFTRENVRAIRPGYGMHTRHLEEVVGRRASRRIERGTPMSADLIQGA